MTPFPCPNYGWKHSKRRRKSKFSIFSTRGRRSTKVTGWFRASKHQKTDLLGFEEVYSVAREAKNNLWSSHREPCWTEQISANFCWGKNKQENRSHAKCLDWYTSCYSPYNYGTTISRSINILKNHITSAGTLNHNTRIQLKLEIWRNWTRNFQTTVQASLERNKRLAQTYEELTRVQVRRSRQRVCHYKAYRINQEQSRWF